jgi:hypothetical protein
MSITNTTPVPTVPTKLRILAIVIGSGVAVPTNTVGPGTQIDNGDGTFSDAGDGEVTYSFNYTTCPYAEVLVQSCDLMVEPDDTPILNEFGLPLYVDSGSPKSFKITDITKLLPFLSTWETLCTAAEAEVAERLTDGRL